MFLMNWFSGILGWLGLGNKKAKILFLGLDNAGTGPRPNAACKRVKRVRVRCARRDAGCAGKTTLLHMLKEKKVAQLEPTQHPHDEELTMGKLKFRSRSVSTRSRVPARRVRHAAARREDVPCRSAGMVLMVRVCVGRVHDLGGHDVARDLWTDYFVACNAVIYLVDCNDRERFLESKAELDKLLSNDQLQGIPFLILGNKIDMQRAASEAELRQALGLQPHLTGKKTARGDLPKGMRPLELFMVSVIKRMGYREGFQWLASYLD